MVFLFLNGQAQASLSVAFLGNIEKEIRHRETSTVCAPRFVLQETFSKLKIHVLYSRASSNQEPVIMALQGYLASHLDIF